MYKTGVLLLQAVTAHTPLRSLFPTALACAICSCSSCTAVRRPSRSARMISAQRRFPNNSDRHRWRRYGCAAKPSSNRVAEFLNFRPVDPFYRFLQRPFLPPAHTVPSVRGTCKPRDSRHQPHGAGSGRVGGARLQTWSAPCRTKRLASLCPCGP